MTFQDFTDFLRSVAPSHVEIQLGEDDMVRAVDHTASAEAFIKYSEGLDFSLQGILNGEKGPVQNYSFKNEHEMVGILAAKVLECLDGQRRV
jgi:hypothetical protein